MANKRHLSQLSRKRQHGYRATGWNEWRRANPTIKPNLTNATFNRRELFGVDFSHSELEFSHFIHADLEAANFRRANLRKSEFQSANLKNAILIDCNLTDSHLTDANLTRAFLRRANLTNADLRGSILIRADLRGADFTDATIGGTVFGDCDLRGAIGLDTVAHHGPSTVGIDALYASEGDISDVFLRGVGVPEVLITYARALVGTAIEFYSCFISYSHANKSFARRLHDALQGRGIRCWLDEHELLPGDNIYAEVDRGIRLWDKVLLCCSEQSLTSWWVDKEIKIAFEKEQQLWKQDNKEVLALIPLNLDGYLFSGIWQNALATDVRARLAADFTGWEFDNEKFEMQFERVVQALRTDRGRKNPLLGSK